MGRLDGKVCVITGAGGGMGREAAIVFTGEGAKVCVADVDLEQAEETVSECTGDAFALRVNVADEDDVKHMYASTAERYGGSTSSTTTQASRPPTTRPSSTRASRHGSASRT